MAKVRGVASWLLNEAEAATDWLRHQVRGTDRGPLRIVPYRGHGTREVLYLKGRVLRGAPIPAANASDSAWRNLVHTLRRLESDEVPAARVRARVGSVETETLSDDEGYFEFAIPVETAAEECEVWRSVELELLDPVESEGPARAVGRALVPPADARFGVISDIDDTVVKTDATSLLRMARLIFLTNARTRLAFEGVAAFYRALSDGTAGSCTNPVFYVSSSPWSLYELLQEVFDVHGIPKGPLELRDYGISREMLFSTSHHEHKVRAIERILSTHPALSFILLGDSGQQDPEIYQEIADRHPGRILAIYIRDVTMERRSGEVLAIRDALRAQGVEVVFTADTLDAALHAAEHGFIDPATLDEIRGEQRRDRAAPGPLESAVRS
jgi:phosphatidate phosphatase APP1